MKVFELIELLQAVDVDKEIYIYADSSIYSIDIIDELDDRVDINYIKGA